jgi:glyoxylase-like metal-dependent hydrolase (beta-lactamase superfamily II)
VEIADGVHRVKGIRVGNSYIVEAGDGLLAVDTGIPGSATHVLRTVERLGRKPGDVRLIVLTHWHVDHVGSAAELRRATGARVAAHELDAPILAGGELPPKGRRAMRLIIRLFRVRPLSADLLLRDGDDVEGFRVVHVPGHTNGSIALYRDGVAFTGDALLGDRRGRIRPPDPRLSLDPATATASAEKIRALPLRLVLPGHGSPVRLWGVAAPDALQWISGVVESDNAGLKSLLMDLWDGGIVERATIGKSGGLVRNPAPVTISAADLELMSR